MSNGNLDELLTPEINRRVEARLNEERADITRTRLVMADSMITHANVAAIAAVAATQLDEQAIACLEKLKATTTKWRRAIDARIAPPPEPPAAPATPAPAKPPMEPSA